MVTSVGRATLFERVRSVLDCSFSFLSAQGGLAVSYRAAFFPKKTRGTFTWPFNYRTPLRSTAQMRQRVKSKTFSVRYRALNTLRLSSGLAFLALFRILTAPFSS